MTEEEIHKTVHTRISKSEEIQTCPECLGSGEYGSKEDQFCRECNGEGYID
jgi:DnaJ-class molecular chaperone|tara:strand:- start:408 stop:560 length:153 start_codon:yes stop_codon:yes gene_type:complete